MSKRRIPLILLACILAGCGAPTNPLSSDSKASSGQSSDPSSSISSSEEISTCNVYFFDPAGQIYSYVTVEKGNAVDRPVDPVLEGYTFLGWFTRNGEEYDFSSLVYSDLSLFARFEEIVYFEGYREDYLPSNSPLSTEDVFNEGDKDISITLKTDMLTYRPSINADMVRLSGAFKDLTVESIKLQGKELIVVTKGEVKEGEGIITLAKEATDANAFITKTLDIASRHGLIDRSSYRLKDEDTKIEFSLRLTNIRFRNDDNLDKNDYKAKVNSGELAYISVSDPSRYALELTDLSDDFTSADFSLTLPEKLNEAIATELRDSLLIHIAKEALSSDIPLDLHLDLFDFKTNSDVRLYRHNGEEYRGKFKIKLLSCHANDALEENIDKLLVDPLNKNLIFTIDGVDTTLTKLSVTNPTTIEGEFNASLTEAKDGLGHIYLPEVKLSEEASLHFVSSWYDGNKVIPAQEEVTYKFDQSIEPGGGVGTVTQTDEQSYRAIKTSVTESAFPEVASNIDDTDPIINAATGIGMIGFGLYSGNFDTARNAASKLFGIDSIADPTTKILGALSEIADILLDIEKKIDNIANQIEVIQEELEQLGQQALLTNYLSAHASWKAFLTDYFTPLENAVVSYSNDYFRYYYDLVIHSYVPYPGTEPMIELNYDREGNLVFPGPNRALSIDGKIIDKDARKTITVPTCFHALSGIFANDGHVYPSIEDDIIADLFAEGNYDEKLIGDIVKTLRYNAMRSHFEDEGDLDDFTFTFSNFCYAFTGTEFGSNLKTSITPLDCYRIMLETVYNFGFEIEPEFNLTVVKIESVYYCARSFFKFTQFINSGEILSTRYDELDKATKAELTDNRFYHSNIDTKTIYSYAASSYVAYSCDAFGIGVEIDEDYDVSAWLTRMDYFDCTYKEKLPDLSSIDEASVRLMALKVKLYNTLKGTNLSFKDYLGHVGIIPEDKLEKTLGVILTQKGLEDDDDEIEDIKFPSNWKIDTDRDETLAFRGDAYSFADDDTVNGLVCVTWDFVGHGMGDYYVPGNFTNVGYIDSLDGRHLDVWAYYVNFAPVSV